MRGPVGEAQTDVLRFGFVATFLERVEHVLALVALVGAQAPDEVVERLFEPEDEVSLGSVSLWRGDSHGVQSRASPVERDTQMPEIPSFVSRPGETDITIHGLIISSLDVRG